MSHSIIFLIYCFFLSSQLLVVKSDSGISLTQAIANNTQLATYSFNGMCFITGSYCADSFLPPGKVADYFGFQAARDDAPDGHGHSNLFLDNISNNLLPILSSDQLAKLSALATDATQLNLTTQYAMQRFPLMVAFRRNLDGNIPNGSAGLSLTAVQNHSAYIYEIDANLTIARAKMYADVINSFNSSQKVVITNMQTGGFYSWPNASQFLVKDVKGDSQVLLTSYIGDIFTWFQGNLENYTYFCPERQGDYFGAFYVKDAPALINHSYMIPMNRTSDGGQGFINLLDESQKKIIMDVGVNQYQPLMDLVSHRRAISTELVKLLNGGTINETLIRTLDREYGMLDGQISYYYASAFGQVGKTLNDTQKAQMMKIRDLDNYPCSEGYGFVYANNGTYPSVINTDFLFQSGFGNILGLGFWFMVFSFLLFYF